jgi:hypothetical protein
VNLRPRSRPTSSTKATWITAWQVSPDGEAVTEYRASLTPYSATVRRVGQSRGGERYTRLMFAHHFADSRAEAIEKFLTRQTVVFGNMRAGMELALLLITRGMKLRDKEAVEPLGRRRPRRSGSGSTG